MIFTNTNFHFSSSYFIAHSIMIKLVYLYISNSVYKIVSFSTLHFATSFLLHLNLRVQTAIDFSFRAICQEVTYHLSITCCGKCTYSGILVKKIQASNWKLIFELEQDVYKLTIDTHNYIAYWFIMLGS